MKNVIKAALLAIFLASSAQAAPQTTIKKPNTPVKVPYPKGAQLPTC